MKKLLALVCLLAGLSLSAQAGPPAGYTLTFSDDFDNATLDTTKWSAGWPWGGGLNDTYPNDEGLPQNIVLSGGIAHFRVTKGSTPSHATYGSAVATTKFSQKGGYWEARLKMPASAHGLWPAFWMVAQDGSWPPEIDIVEWLGNGPTEADMTVHYGSTNQSDEGIYTGPDFSADFHTFGMLWTDTQLTWYIDGVQRFTTTKGIPTKAMQVILNNDTGGWNNNVVDGSTVFPASFDVDYVRVYAYTGVTQPSTPFDGGLVQNGDFASGTAPWSFFSDGAADWAVDSTGGMTSGAHITVTSIGANTQLYQPNLAVVPNTAYTLSFDAVASSARTLAVGLIKHTDGSNNYGISNQPFAITTTKKTFTYTFTSSSTASSDGRISFGLGSIVGGTFASGDQLWIDNISLKAVPAAGPTIVQSKSNSNPQPGNPSLTFSSATGAGHAVVVGCAAYGVPSSLTGVSDSAGNTYTLIKSATYDTSAVNHMALYSAIAQTSATLTITCNLSNPGGESAIMAVEVANLADNPIDVSAAVSNVTGSSVTTPGIATTTANEVLIGFAALNSQTVAPTAGSGFTALETTCGCNAVEAAILEYQQVSAAGSYTATANAASSANWGAIVVGIKVTTSGGGGDDGGGSGPVTTTNIGPSGAINPQPAGSRNVKTDCSAAGNGSTDDLTAINNCINGLSANQALYFPDGTYVVNGVVHLKPGHTYLGQSNNAVIKESVNGHALMDTDYTAIQNITIDNLTFDGGTFYLNGPATGACGLTIQNNIFRNNTGNGPANFESTMFIMAETGFGGCSQGVKIRNNKFQNLLYNGQTRVNNDQNYDGDVPRSAIMSYGFDRTNIDHNIFENVYEGVKGCFAHSYADQNPYIGYNLFNQVHRMPIEIQGGQGCGHPTGLTVDSNNLVIEYNLAQNWNDVYWESFGISLADWWDVDALVHHNAMMSSPYVNPNGQAIGYEIGGTPVHAYSNLGFGPWGPGTAVFNHSTNPEVNNSWFCQLNPGQNSPNVADERNPFDTVYPTNPNYHDNFLHNTCPATSITGTTSISLSVPSVASGNVTASSTVTTINPAIATVAFSIDGNVVATKSIAQYQLLESVSLPASLTQPTSSLAPGNHTLTARATDVWGNTWDSTSRTFQVTSAPTFGPPITATGNLIVTGNVTAK